MSARCTAVGIYVPEEAPVFVVPTELEGVTRDGTETLRREDVTFDEVTGVVEKPYALQYVPGRAVALEQ